MRWYIPLAFVLIILNLAVAEVEISGLKDEYLLGENVYVNASIDYKKEVYGFFKLSLDCGRKSQDYFLIPLLVREGKTATVSPEPIRISNKVALFGDTCRIYASFDNEAGNEILSQRSSGFEITSRFNVSIEVEDKLYNPGDTLVVDISLDTSDDAFTEVFVDLTVDKKLSRYESDKKDFTVEYTLPASVSSGEQKILLQVEDLYGNYEEKELTIEVAQKISKIKHIYSKKIYDANNSGEIFIFKPVLYDQSGNVIDDRLVEVSISDPEGNIVASDNVLSTLQFKYDITKDLVPGEYTIVSKYHDIEGKTFFQVLNKGYEKPKVVVPEDKPEEVAVEKTLVDNGYDEQSPNFWRVTTFILILCILIYAAYAYGKRSTKKVKKKGIFRDNEFSKKKENKKN